jgi:hypothetical protein
MRCWTRLITWAAEERASARVYARLSQASAWFAEGTAGLWHNPELELGVRWKRQNHPTEAWAERYDSSFARAMDFLDRSEKEQNRIEAERENARKNKLRLAWSVAGSLGVLLLVALYFYHVAQTERSRAEANLGLARKAVDESLSSAGKQQGRESPDPPQLEQFREELLKKAEEFYSKFLAEQSKNDLQFRADSALVHSKLGDINRLLEKREDAVAQYRLAISGFEELFRETPGNPEYRQDLAYAHHWLGETLRLWLEEDENPKPPISLRCRDGIRHDALRLQQDLHRAARRMPTTRKSWLALTTTAAFFAMTVETSRATESDFREAVRLLNPWLRKTKNHKRRRVKIRRRTTWRVCTIISVLLSDQGYFERAIRIQEDLAKKAQKTGSTRWN